MTGIERFECRLNRFQRNHCHVQLQLQGFFNGDPVSGDPNTGAFEVLSGNSQTISDVFGLQLGATQPSGTYEGLVTFTGQTAAGYPKGGDVELGAGALTLKVAAVPEASSAAGFGLLLVLGGAMLARRNQRTRI